MAVDGLRASGVASSTFCSISRKCRKSCPFLRKPGSYNALTDLVLYLFPLQNMPVSKSSPGTLCIFKVLMIPPSPDTVLTTQFRDPGSGPFPNGALETHFRGLLSSEGGGQGGPGCTYCLQRALHRLPQCHALAERALGH